MTDALLFLHLLSAAAVFAAIAGFTALVFGTPLDRGTITLFRILWNGGLIGALLFGFVLAIDVDGYSLLDAWILIALALWIAVGPIGERAPRAYLENAWGSRAPAALMRSHWLGTALVVLLLADMIWKPWA